MTDETNRDPAEEASSDDMKETFEEEPIIPEEDFREAIAACRQDPQLNRYFELAPTGAKLFIGLMFYSTHFGDKVDPRQYAQCQAEIEPALMPNDLRYLIRFERDKATKQYLRELLAQRKAEATPEETPKEATTEAVAPPEPSDAPFRPPIRKLRRVDPVPVPQPKPALPPRAGFPSEVAFQPKAPKASSNRTLGDLLASVKAVASYALLLGGACALYFMARPSAPQPDEEPPQAEETPVTPVQAEKADAPPPAAVRPETAPQPEPRVEETPARPDTKKEDVSTHVADIPVDVGTETPPTDTPSEAAPPAEVVVTRKKEPSRGPRVVLTDGKKIVRRSGGLIEVPRVFSCAGAGIRPFWVYSSQPEADAAKEKKARDEWQALVREARADGNDAAGDKAATRAGTNML